jgi:putative GTP pyrophosphokinase
MTKERIDILLKEYEEKYPIYEEFSSRLKLILEDVLVSEDLSYLSVESRTKAQVNLRQKIESGTINVSKLVDVRDLTGVRINTYVYEDITKIENVLKENFDLSQIEIDERLGINKVGYRSHHWVLTLPSQRVSLPEYKKFEGLKAELQIRTVLQHAWAQIGHNQIYKPNVLLPDKIKRDFTLLSGLLEIADNEFSRISQEISKYTEEIDIKTSTGDLNVKIDSVSLRSYFDNKFAKMSNVEKKFGPKDDMIELIIEELNLIGVSTLREFDEIIPVDFIKVSENLDRDSNYTGVARNIMVISKPEQYFEHAWRNNWIIGKDSDLSIYTQYNIDVETKMNKYLPNLQ